MSTGLYPILISDLQNIEIHQELVCGNIHARAGLAIKITADFDNKSYVIQLPLIKQDFSDDTLNNNISSAISTGLLSLCKYIQENTDRFTYVLKKINEHPPCSKQLPLP